MIVPLLLSTPARIPLPQSTRDGGLAIVIPIAELCAGARLVSVECTLSPMEPDNAIAYEFAFSIVVASMDGTAELFVTQDRTMAAPYIPDECRPHIVPAVCDALRHLVENVRPQSIYRVTKDMAPAAAARAKHERMTSTLKALGYSVAETGTDRFGRVFWLMNVA